MRLPNLLESALLCFVSANLIHNSGGLDPAVVPATALTVIYWWRPGPGLSRATALAIAVPAIVFFKWSALADPSSLKAFVNHVALFGAATFATAAAVHSFRPVPRARA